MKGNLTLQLVPHLPPALSGVGDYATLLHQELNRRGAGEGREFRLLACGWQEQPQLLDPTSINLSGPRRQGRLLETLLSLPVNGLYLHYVGYGYAPRGAPTWLLHALRSYRRERPSVRLGVMFHELYATGLPWQSSFWLSPRQRKIAAQLARLADFWVTNREQSAAWLRSVGGGTWGEVLPVFSNVGEGNSTGSEVRRGIVIFGGAGLRTATYAAAGEELFRFARERDQPIHDIGTPVSGPRLRQQLEAEQVLRHGTLPPERISPLMAGSLYGALAYPVAFAAKSTVLAAYAAHGLCPILLSMSTANNDGLCSGIHFLEGIPGSERTHTQANAVEIGQHAFRWYGGHGLQIQADRLFSLLGSRGEAHAC